MKNLQQLVGSTIGRKILVALTGLALFGFLLVHLAGNLLIFEGQDAMNAYAQTLKGNVGLLWFLRSGLAAVFLIHIWSSLTLNFRSHAARPTAYAMRKAVQSTFMSRTMARTGILIGLFVVYHLLHFTVGVTNPEHFQSHQELAEQASRHDVYTMVILGFRTPYITGIYVFAMILLATHLSHGISSTVQTLGFNHPVYSPLLKKLGILLALAIAIGNCTIAISIFTRMVGGEVQ